MSSNKKQKIRFRLVSAGIVIFASIATLLIFNQVILFGNYSSLNSAAKIAENEPFIPKNVTPTYSYGVPARLIIPKINVDANVIQVGLTALGNMESPNTNTDAGWYRYGPRPGNEGSSVIAGHVGLGSIKGVFSQLRTLQQGDMIMVIDNKGDTVSFIVRTTKLYDKDAQPVEVFSSTSGSHLNLITCEGTWESPQQTYSQRLVVFADKV